MIYQYNLVLFFLTRPENKTVLSLLTVLSVVVIYTIHCRRPKCTISQEIMFLVGACLVYCCRAANGAVIIPYCYIDSIEKYVFYIIYDRFLYTDILRT